MDENNLPESDIWSEWLLHGRDGSEERYAREMRALVERYVERVLDGAALKPGERLADVGAGEGLLALRALERTGGDLQVWLTDVSEPMLRHARRLVSERGAAPRCTFLCAAAEQLTGLADASLDAVTTRSVLAYVADKTAALREFHRVLRPGGRISLGEPVFQDEAVAAQAMRTVIESNPPEAVSPLLRLMHRWKAAQFPDTDQTIRASAIAGYSERDLVRFAQTAGFTDVHMELHIDTLPSIVRTWETFINTSPHPLAPPLRTIMAEKFTAEERALFERGMRPVIEDPRAVSTERMAYLTARKPLA